ncbi:MAG: hypothetical protein C4292_02115, partial [Nitrososphaera sp.]
RYHVTDPKAFIEARKFYDTPADAGKGNDISPYYIVTRPRGFSEPAFVGLQPLELAGSQTRNLAGYMIVENDPASHGKMTFYSVPPDSPTKLVGPTAAREALEKDKDYKNLKSMLQGTPRVGESMLYRIGDQEVYFIPVYTAAGSSAAGGAAPQIGTIAAVGATAASGVGATQRQVVGLGDMPVEAFENYLTKAAGGAPVSQPTGKAPEDFDAQDRIRTVEKLFEDRGLQVVNPTALTVPVEFREAQVRYVAETDFAAVRDAIMAFVDKFASPSPAEGGGGEEGARIFQWQEGKAGGGEGGVGDNGVIIVNFGVLRTVNGIVESHYISVQVS